MAVLLETTVGDLVVDLYPEERPRCCLNFLKLCKIKYFNFCVLHSIQRNFMAQTGDPSGTGKGGASIFSKLYGDQAKYFEMENNPRIKHKKKGALSMVNNGENMHGSQFFFTLAEDLDYLDGQHTVFGEVTEGFDVIDKINEAFCDKENRPYQDIRISHTIVLDDPFDDPEGLVIPDRSPEPTKEQLESGRIGADEEIEDDKGKSKEEMEDEEKKKDATANAQILEMIGDLPDADVKPPENVLFVCKLNPLTTSEDLEIIFSRFGKISRVNFPFKDKVTGDSLSYAFIEFEREEDCEEAYFKMDNVLIDDRRIHVDFSQSVAKLKMGPSGPVIPQKEGESSKYAIKDTKSKQSQKYGLVLDEDDNYGGHQRSYQKKQRSYSSESDIENERHRNKSKKKEKRDRKRDGSSAESSSDDRRRQKKKRRKDRRGSSSSSEDERKRKRKEKRARDDSESEDDRRKERSQARHRKAASGSSEDERYSRRRPDHDRFREDRSREDDRGRDEERRRRKDDRREKDRYSGRDGERDDRYREKNREKYRERNRDR